LLYSTKRESLFYRVGCVKFSVHYIRYHNSRSADDTAILSKSNQSLTQTGEFYE
jgi:hypothetical protein